jgi:hypothetical protein
MVEIMDPRIIANQYTKAQLAERVAQLESENERLWQVIRDAIKCGATADYFLQDWLDAFEGADDAE